MSLRQVTVLYVVVRVHHSSLCYDLNSEKIKSHFLDPIAFFFFLEKIGKAIVLRRRAEAAHLLKWQIGSTNPRLKLVRVSWDFRHNIYIYCCFLDINPLDIYCSHGFLKPLWSPPPLMCKCEGCLDIEKKIWSASIFLALVKSYFQ